MPVKVVLPTALARHTDGKKSFDSDAADLAGLLAEFDAKFPALARVGVERRLAIMGAVLSAVALESHFKPHLFPKLQMKAVLEELFEALVHA